MMAVAPKRSGSSGGFGAWLGGRRRGHGRAGRWLAFDCSGPGMFAARGRTQTLSCPKILTTGRDSSSFRNMSGGALCAPVRGDQDRDRGCPYWPPDTPSSRSLQRIAYSTSTSFQVLANMALSFRARPGIETNGGDTQRKGGAR